MIGQLAHKVISQTDEYANLQVIVSQADAVETVATLLTEITTELGRWVEIYPCLEPLMSVEYAESIRQTASALRSDLARSHAEFEAQHVQAQAIKLTQSKSRLEKMRNQTREAWRAYAQSANAPYLELARIAEHLDAMRQHMEEVSGHLAIVQRLSLDLPTKAENVDKFHISLRRLHDLLGDLEGLPSDVRAFLESLMRGNATMAQVTPTVFEWCHIQGLSDKLHVQW